MQAKKSAKADLQNKRVLFLEIGLIVALSLSIAIFTWSTPERKMADFSGPVFEIPVELPPPTRQEEKKTTPPPRILINTGEITIKPNDAVIKTGYDWTPEDFGGDVVIPKAERREVGVEEPIHLFVEKMPSFNGGDLNDFRNWVMQRLNYPQIAIDNGVQGKVTLEFVIEKDGSISGIRVLQSPDNSLADEATRVLSQSPKWEPGLQQLNTVRVKFTIPIDFRLQN